MKLLLFPPRVQREVKNRVEPKVYILICHMDRGDGNFWKR